MSKESSIFYHPSYLDIQEHKKLLVFDTDDFYVAFSISKDLAISLPQGLFGSIVKKKRAVNFHAFQDFWKEVYDGLVKEKVTRAEIVHPPDIYGGFVQWQWLNEVGFSRMYVDVNHHIPLKDFHLHKMEEKKLRKLSTIDFSVRMMDTSELQIAYDLLDVSREEKGLKINITYQRLSDLFRAFPDRYDIFMGYLNQKPACAVITLQVAPQVVYYFLPGTLEAAKGHSPMVGLLDHIVGHYADTHTYLDLGVSSVVGKPQDGLIAFKERMGGVKSGKNRFFIRI